MKQIKFLMGFLAVFALTAGTLSADGECDLGDYSTYDQDLEEKDWDALYDYINTKRTINLQEKGCALTISGDVRVDWRHCDERRCDEDLRGTTVVDHKGFPVPRDDLNIIFSLRYDYVCGRAWSVGHFEFNNSAGISINKCENDENGLHGSGASCDISLKKAYMGYNICCNGATRFDVEVGRRKLYQIFESNVQFLSTFDGILLRYDSNINCCGDYCLKLAGFVVDERVNHYAWIAQGELFDVCDSGIDLKYSFIDWIKNGTNRCKVQDPLGAKFLVSQWTASYRFTPEMLRVPTKLYAAVLFNHYATTPPGSNMDKENMAWYLGFEMGKVVYAYDWSFDTQFQWVEAFSVPNRDMSGIGNGNMKNESIYNPPYVGNTNFYGIRIQGLYAVTDNLTINSRFEWSKNIISLEKVQNHHFNQYRLELIYAF